METQPPKKEGAQPHPQFWPMFIVVKRLDGLWCRFICR